MVPHSGSCDTQIIHPIKRRRLLRHPIVVREHRPILHATHDLLQAPEANHGLHPRHRRMLISYQVSTILWLLHSLCLRLLVRLLALRTDIALLYLVVVAYLTGSAVGSGESDGLQASFLVVKLVRLSEESLAWLTLQAVGDLVLVKVC